MTNVAQIESQNPRLREAVTLREIVSEQMSARGAKQPSVLVEPFGYGAEDVLALVYHSCRRGDLGEHAMFCGIFPTRHDLIRDWLSLAIAILSNANRVDSAIGATREDLSAARMEWGDERFADELEEWMDALSERGTFTLFAPRLDLLIKALDDRQDWTFRGALQKSTILLIGSAPASWRPNRNDAFFEFFRRIRLDGYGDASLTALGKQVRLNKTALQTLRAFADRVEGRPALIESAAGRLSVYKDASVDDLMRYVSVQAAPYLEELLNDAAPQARFLFAEATIDGFPTTSSRLATLTGLATNSVSAQLTRLEDEHLLRTDKSVGRNRQYEAPDAVLASVYRASITNPDNF